MSRTAYVCPRCGTRLAWKRRGGTVVAVPDVPYARAHAVPGVFVVCPGCREVLVLPGVRLALLPEKGPEGTRGSVSPLDTAVSDEDNPAPGT